MISLCLITAQKDFPLRWALIGYRKNILEFLTFIPLALSLYGKRPSHASQTNYLISSPSFMMGVKRRGILMQTIVRMTQPLCLEVSIACNHSPWITAMNNCVFVIIRGIEIFLIDLIDIVNYSSVPHSVQCSLTAETDSGNWQYAHISNLLNDTQSAHCCRAFPMHFLARAFFHK